jgi:hypothetical protein
MTRRTDLVSSEPLAEGLLNRGDRRSLSVAHGILAATTLSVRVGDLLREVDDEALVLVELLRGSLTIE